MLRFNGDFLIYNPFSQFNFNCWSMSPHCTGRIAKFLILRHISHRVVLHFLFLSGQHAMVISALFWAWVHLWSALVAFRKEFSILWRISYQTVLCLSLFTCNTQWSFQLCSRTGCIYDLVKLHLNMNFQSTDWIIPIIWTQSCWSSTLISSDAHIYNTYYISPHIYIVNVILWKISIQIQTCL